MWLCTRFGFFSITRKRPGEWHVRGRTRRDLAALRAAAGLDEPVLRTAPADYRWRIVLTDPAALARVFDALRDSIDYDNFKDTIHDLPDQHDKSPIYARWWSDMWAYQQARDGREGTDDEA